LASSYTPVLLGEPERVVGAVGADLERVQRQAQVVDRRRRRREVVDDVHRLVDEERLDDIPVLVAELRAPDVLDVGEGSRLEVVHADDAMAASEQLIAQMRSEESRTTRDEAGGHSAARISGATAPERP
jgi:hypothetical protein